MEDGKRHVCLYVLQRKETSFEFAVCNTGEGMQQVNGPGMGPECTLGYSIL